MSALFFRSLVFFYFSFLWSATLTVVPQRFFLTNYPTQKNLLLSLLLLAGSLVGVVAIEFSHRYFINKKFAPSHSTIILSFSAILGSFIWLFLTTNLAMYFLSFIVLKFITNFFYNCFDHYLLRMTGPKELHFYANINQFYQLIGIVTAVFYFTFFYEFVFVHLVLLGILTFVVVNALLGAPADSVTDDTPVIADNSNKVSKLDKYFLAFILLIMSALTLFVMFVMYLIKEYYFAFDYQTQAGYLIGIANLVGALTILLLMALRVARSKVVLLVLMLVSNIILLLNILLFYARLSLSAAYLNSLGVLTGCAYGFFISATRCYLVKIVKEKNHQALLSAGNNIFNYAMAIAFCCASVLTLVCSTLKIDFFFGLFGFLLTILLLALIVYCQFAKNYYKDRGVV